MYMRRPEPFSVQACILVAFLSIASELPSARAQTMPRFVVPGAEEEMQTLEALHALHHERAFTDCTLWDGWLPQSTLWVSERKRAQNRDSLSQRRIDGEGYVSMQQHRGMAHSEGWPFPAWQQSTGVGFHFSTERDVWAVQHFALQAAASIDGWEIQGADVLGITPSDGLQLRLNADECTLTTPSFRCGTIAAPFIRLEWCSESMPSQASSSLQWQIEGEDTWRESRAVPVPKPPNGTFEFENVPAYRHPEYQGLLQRIRISIRGGKGATLRLKSVITAIDTRHPITNALFVRACADTYLWTKDIAFLTHNLPRIRRAMSYALREFDVQTQHHVVVPWVGHDGRSGLVFDAEGRKTLRPGVGVGNNYWDLLPFGAHDAIATMYLYDALSAYAKLETAAARIPNLSDTDGEQLPLPLDKIDELAALIRIDFQKRFWNPGAGRFVGWIDRDGRAVDYGFTFVNLEAIHYGLASDSQAIQIMDWISGQRIIADDTSQGADIYRWRFAPRATTKRNIETYVWVWSHPESIAWGDQVQDGGAVLGFSYFDLMSRLRVHGPDNAWARLQEILEWFREVQAEGGYRSYYGKPGRGILQGGGPPGGLGMDQEFMESILVPQIMLYGFLGFEPTVDGYRISPRLPSAWPSLTITNIHIGNELIDITAYPDGRFITQPTNHP